MMTRLSRWFNGRGWRQVIVGTPYVWLTLFFFLPFVIVVGISLARTAPSSPPLMYKPGFPWIFWEGYERLVTDTLYIRAYFTSVFNAAIATICCLLIGYPMALGLTRVSRTWRNFLL